MNTQTTRREILKGSLALAGLGVLGIPEWALPALAQGETLVPFTDIPENVRWETPPDRRTLDVSTIDSPFTPRDKFATTQHYGHPDVNPATFRLKVSGLVDRPKSLSLDDLKKRRNWAARSSWPDSNAPATADHSRVCAATGNGPACR